MFPARQELNLDVRSKSKLANCYMKFLTSKASFNYTRIFVVCRIRLTPKGDSKEKKRSDMFVLKLELSTFAVYSAVFTTCMCTAFCNLATVCARRVSYATHNTL